MTRAELLAAQDRRWTERYMAKARRDALKNIRAAAKLLRIKPTRDTIRRLAEAALALGELGAPLTPQAIADAAVAEAKRHAAWLLDVYRHKRHK